MINESTYSWQRNPEWFPSVPYKQERMTNNLTSSFLTSKSSRVHIRNRGLYGSIQRKKKRLNGCVWDEEKDIWCRAHVLSNWSNQIIPTTSDFDQNISTPCSAGLTTFRLIDYGVDKTMTVDKNVKTMSRFLRQFASFACRCSIQIDENEFDENKASNLLRSIFEG